MGHRQEKPSALANHVRSREQDHQAVHHALESVSCLCQQTVVD